MTERVSTPPSVSLTRAEIEVAIDSGDPWMCRNLLALALIRPSVPSETKAPICNRCGGLGYVLMTNGLGGQSKAPCTCPAASSAIAPSDAYKDAVAMNLKLRKALEQSVRVTRMWHAMPKQPGPNDDFDIYFNHSPEMKLVREALGKMPEQE